MTETRQEHAARLDALRRIATALRPITRAELADLNRNGEHELVAGYAGAFHALVSREPIDREPPPPPTSDREPLRGLSSADLT